jgi:hypothetical protein
MTGIPKDLPTTSHWKLGENGYGPSITASYLKIYET